LALVMILIAVAAARPPADERAPVRMPACFSAALAAFVAVYYVWHAVLLGTTII
jgi:hypothetical protein